MLPAAAAVRLRLSRASGDSVQRFGPDATASELGKRDPHVRL